MLSYYLWTELTAAPLNAAVYWLQSLRVARLTLHLLTQLARLLLFGIWVFRVPRFHHQRPWLRSNILIIEGCALSCKKPRRFLA